MLYMDRYRISAGVARSMALIRPRHNFRQNNNSINDRRLLVTLHTHTSLVSFCHGWIDRYTTSRRPRANLILACHSSSPRGVIGLALATHSAAQAGLLVQGRAAISRKFALLGPSEVCWRQAIAGGQSCLGAIIDRRLVETGCSITSRSGASGQRRCQEASLCWSARDPLVRLFRDCILLPAMLLRVLQH